MLKKILNKVLRSFIRFSAYQIICDSIYMLIVFWLTGSTLIVVGSISLMKILCGTTYVLHDTLVKYKSMLIKALMWELIISVLGVTINFLVTGNFAISFKIMILMKIVIPIHYIWLRVTK